MPKPELVRLPLRLRTLVRDHGPDDVRPSVRCPRQGAFIDARICTGCARMRDVEWDPVTGGAITCEVERARAVPRLIDDGRTDFAEAATRKQLHEIAALVTVCVLGSTPAGRVREVLAARDLEGVPVVDDELRVLGVVTRKDLVDVSHRRPVKELVGTELRALPEDSPIAHAIALMAFERVSQVPIVTADGELVGVIDATAALRWAAERLGYVGR